MAPSPGLQRLQHQFYLFVARAALGIAAFGYAWLAWIDAPVDAAAVACMGLASLLASICIVAAAAARSGSLAPAATAAEPAGRRERRSRRLALTALVLAGLFTAAACCLTLPLKQTDADGDDGDDTPTNTSVVWPLGAPAPARLNTPAA